MIAIATRGARGRAKSTSRAGPMTTPGRSAFWPSEFGNAKAATRIAT
jgi:hypothetical protein